ncbi:MAG TPA: carboxypeptidase-like regulatory domain-containing protein, partial [Vicinamibacterales bacterium]|nr:carboxypeptidase-like regulatory domain-containing protein [Vicinamibacterales bacterium]
MRHRLLMVCLVASAALALLPATASAQEGQIAGTVRDSSGAVIPGVTIEATSPALIEKVRSATTDTNGQYRLTNLPVGIYKVTFTLSGFAKQERDAIELTSGFTAPVNATMSVGNLAETITVAATSPVVDVQNARQAITFEGDALKELPTSRNVNALLTLTPGIASNYRTGQSFGQPGVCVGGIGVFCNPSVNGFNQGDSGSSFDNGFGDTNGANNLNQGRIMVDGQVVNGGTVIPGGLGGMSTGYTADIAGAQEVNIQLSGALGESETGGASINIVPRTGGNKFAGSWNTTYTNENMFSSNTDAFRKGCNDTPPGICVPAVFQAVRFDYDVSGSYGGPIVRDRAWFYGSGRDQQIRKLPVGVDFWPNLNEGKWGYNYQPDRSKDRVEYQNKWKSYSGRFTYQATQKNKFNVYWDEQDFCQDPCDGVVSVFTSPESWWSVAIKPNRLQQVSWTNPFTNKILFEAGISVTSQFYDTTRHRQYTDPIDIPRVDETGDTAGADSTAPRVNQFAGNGGGFALTSGSLVSGIAGGGAETRDMKNYRSRASMSYVTGSHHAKFGYDGGYYLQDQRNMMNGPRLYYHYMKPNTNCATTADLSTYPCGNTSLQFPEDPFNLALRPVPLNVQFFTGAATVGDRVWFGAAYAQDQWTFRRFTLSGALRYDHAASSYKSTCIGGANEPYMPVQPDGTKGYCTADADGVSFDDITPRWGATYDLFGNGKTSLKLNMGKYNNQAAITGIYSGANPARRTVNSLQRAWNDT